MPTFSTPDPIALHVNFPAGDLVVTASDRADTTVEVTPDDYGAADYLESVKITHRDGVVQVKAPDSSRLRRTPSLDIVVEVPTGSRVVVDTASADVRIRGQVAGIEFTSASGDLDATHSATTIAKTASGDITFDVIDDVATITTASGDIRVTEARGPITATVISGDLVIAKAASDASIKSTSGDVSLHCVTSGKIGIQTTSGDATVAVHQGTAAWLDVNSLTGRVTSALTQDTTEPSPTEQTVEITARSLSGDIAITRAESTR
ncbi:DUF4097 family beta strand repeat-containing protein [Nonomuraea endophytica]|uniref:DUF4097 and DUF4098 domain-containing protein YvlB n=1 Tax=Nonomuraea endophytica TaxID=714136 RepID=A0A7W8ACI2_9ACTN|nr:DUF4097 family beta strand repeat-containing protein [Nonomuraea endophytica]MBB5082581.1 DUF4097 and DUF4098 domain-containing protein YvlB [Nonomuraea endophytica]